MFDFKIVFLGKPNSGQTKLIQQLTKPGSARFDQHSHTFDMNIYNTKGIVKSLVDDVELNIYDIHGITTNRVYLEYSNAAYYTVDANTINSNSAVEDYTDIQENIALFKQLNPGSPVILVATKADNASNAEQVKALEHLSQHLGCAEYIVTSALNNIGLTELKESMLSTIDEQVKTQDILFHAESIKTCKGLYDALVALNMMCRTLDSKRKNQLALETRELAKKLRNPLFETQVAAVEAFKHQSLMHMKGVDEHSGRFIAFFLGSFALAACIITSVIVFLVASPLVIIATFAAGLVALHLVFALTAILGGIGIWNLIQKEKNEEPIFSALDKVHSEARLWISDDHVAKLLSDQMRHELQSFITYKEHCLEKKSKAKEDSKSYYAATELLGQLNNGATARDIVSKPENERLLPKNGSFFSKAMNAQLYAAPVLIEEDYVPLTRPGRLG